METRIEVDKDRMIEMSKPLFYGFVVLSAVSLLKFPSYAGTLLGVAMLAAITLIASGIGEMLEDDWSNFMEIIAMVTLMSAILAGSYLATVLSFA